MRDTLLLFTGSYPYAAAAENTFLPQEIAVLGRQFGSVRVIPVSTGGARAMITAPNVSVDTSFSAFRSSSRRRLVAAVGAVADARFWSDLLPHLAMYIARPIGLVRLIRAYVDARLAERWAARQDLPWSECISCTWWFEGTTLGLATFGRLVGMPVATRAHGRDVYEERQTPKRIPFRRESLAAVSAVFSASEAGARYMTERYPGFGDRIRVGLLGTDDSGVTNEPSRDGVFRVLSCSALVPVKRVELIIAGVAAAGRSSPEQRFRWTHIGVGPERPTLEAQAARVMPSNVEHEFRDYRGADDLFGYYRDHPADVFMNTSASEGTPVAIMEAISVGLPVIATDVGGNPEIVTKDNGIVIPANPEPGEIAAAILRLLGDAEGRGRLRDGSRRLWRERYAAERNYVMFADSLRGL